MFLSPEVVNGPWTKQEDELLLKLHTEHGPKWSKISKFFKGRSDCNVKNRWSRYLRLQASGFNPLFKEDPFAIETTKCLPTESTNIDDSFSLEPIYVEESEWI